jgi:type I restriction enzyme S subunit
VIFPPLPEQRRIADILSTLDEQIQLTDKLIDETRELKKGLSNDLFLKGVGHENHKSIQLGPKQFEIPQDWEIKQISEVCDDIIDYRGKTPSYSDSGIPHIRNFNIEENRLIMDDIDYVSEETYDEWMTRGIPQEGDVFFTTEAPLGKAAMVPDFRFSLAQRLVVLQPGDEITGEWLMYLLTSVFMKEYYHTRATGSTVKGLSNRALQKVKVFVPPIEEQSKITNCLSNVDAKLYQELEYKEELQNLKRGLMQDLLTGKVRVDTD